MARNVLIEQLYDMAKTTDESGMSVFDEQKFRKEMESNKDFMRSNKNTFEEKEPKVKTCKRYDRCPICEKCRVKASHLYISCQTCQIPICVHDSKTINRMIRRENFVIKPKNKDIIKAIKNARDRIVSKGSNDAK